MWIKFWNMFYIPRISKTISSSKRATPSEVKWCTDHPRKARPARTAERKIHEDPIVIKAASGFRADSHGGYRVGNTTDGKMV